MFFPYLLSRTLLVGKRFMLGCLLFLFAFDVFAAATTVSSISITSTPVNVATGYLVGEVVTATVVFSGTETITGIPTLMLNIGGVLRTATYSGGTGTKNITFRYTIVSGDSDPDGISINANSIALSGGTIKNGTTVATLTHTAIAASAADLVAVPGVATNVSTISITSAPADGASYHTGEVVSATVAFVKTAGGAAAPETVTGTPSLQLDIGGVMRTASYSSGSGTANVVFTYTVVASDVDLDGIAIPANSISLNGGSISNGASSPVSATLTHLAIAADAADKVALPSSPLVLRSAFGAGSTITLNYDQIDSPFANITPLPSVFSFSRNGGVGGQLSVTSVVVDPIARTVSLGLNGLINYTDTNLSISYTPTGTNDIQNVAGDKVAAFSNFFVANAMPVFNVNANKMVFNNGVLKAGTGLTAGSKYLYSNAITIDGQAIDAVVTISALTGSTITGVDGVVGTDAAALTPLTGTAHTDMFTLNTTVANTGGDATFLFEFIKSGTYGTTTTASTGVDVILQNVAMNSYDLDTTGGTMKQYQEFGGFATYTVSTSSKLDQTQYPGFTRFQANPTVAANVTSGPGTVAGDDIRVMALYESIHSFSIKTGETATGGMCYFYIDFSIGPTWASGATGGVTYQIPTVNPRVTNVTTPTLTGTFVGTVTNATDQAYKLTIKLNGKTYTAGEAAGERTTLVSGDIQLLDATTGLRGIFNPTTGIGTWSVTIPVADALPLATYDVTAQVDYGVSLATINRNTTDTTTNELVINATPADVTPPTLTKIERQNPLGEGITPSSLLAQNYVDFKVTLSEAVTNAGVADFEITGAGSTGATLSSVTQSSVNTYTVRISNIPAGNLGILDLNLRATTDLVDLAGNNLVVGAADPEGVVPTTGIDETYMISTIEYDYGDAPSGVTVDTVARSYGSASHIRPTTPTIYLGTTLPDADTSVNQATWQANSTNPAHGDDIATSIDEGIAQLLSGAPSSFPVLTAGATSYALTLVCRGTTLANAISGWIDFNKNGAFDAGEFAQGTCSSGDATAGSATLTWAGLTGLKTGVTFARFRMASAVVDVATPAGMANDGEVEDYPITILAGVKVVVTTPDAGKFNLTVSGGTPVGGSNPANDVVNLGTTGFVGVDAGGAITVQEAEGTSTLLSNYTTVLTCTLGDGTTAVTLSASTLTGTPRSGAFVAPALNSVGTAAQVVCTFANTTAGVSVSGQVYSDANYSGILDVGESWIDGGATMYAKLFAGVCPATGTATSVQTMTVAASSYTFTGVAAGNYCAVLSNNADPAISVASVPVGWLNVSPPLGWQNWVVADKNLINQNFGLFHGSIVVGRVFRDNGVGAGEANNGVQDAGETVGIAGVVLTANHAACSVPWCVATTDGNGDFIFRLPAAIVGAVSVVETNPNGMLSTGGSAGTTGGTYTRTSDTTAFTVVVGSIYTGLLFGDVPDNQFMTDGALAAIPGSIVFYPHRFVAGTTGTVTFNVSQLPSPAVIGWSELIYQDTNCDSVMNAGDVPVTANMAVTAGTTVCLLVKEFVPANAAINAQNALTLTANVGATFSGTSVSFSYVRHDTTTVGQASAAGLSLVKRVSTTTALPGDNITYYIDYSNNSSGPLSNVVISDATPAYTTYQGASCGTPPLNFLCSVTTAPGMGATGSIVFSFTGSMNPSTSGTVSFTVQVQP